MTRDTAMYIKDILLAIEDIEKFVNGLKFEQFEEDDKTASAVVRKFEIIGEASKSLPQKVKAEMPEIPWKTMIGMRDRLIHAYFGIDYYLVWKTIKQDLPKLKPVLKKMLSKQ